MTLEVLAVTMNQNDNSLYEKMNIRTDAIIANQCDRYDYSEYDMNGKTLKMISTGDRGVGKNRNQALLCATADILLFADDDGIYRDDYEEKILEAYERLPYADIIVFDVSIHNTDRKSRKEKKAIKKVGLMNFMRYGTYCVSARRESLLKGNIWFSLLYGGGARYSSGEDSLFLKEALDKGLKIYFYPYNMADVLQQESTWFKGYNDKFFIDKGIWTANAFPFLKYLCTVYFAYRFKKLAPEYTHKQIFKLVLSGIKEFKRRQNKSQD